MEKVGSFFHAPASFGWRGGRRKIMLVWCRTPSVPEAIRMRGEGLNPGGAISFLLLAVPCLLDSALRKHWVAAVCVSPDPRSGITCWNLLTCSLEMR